MIPLQLNYKNSLINYYRFGEGATVAICFHGYGEDARSWLFLEKHAGSDYSFIAIDLPFHGKTVWNEGLNFSHNDLQDIVGQILNTKSSQEAEQYVLMGYSLGGRIALSFYQSQPAQVSRLVLLAADGLMLNPWYWLATQTRVGNRLFRFTMEHPSWFFRMLKVLNKMGMVNTSIFKFVNYYIGDKEFRDLLYTRWTSLRKLRPNLGRIRSSVRAEQTPVRLLYGKHDRIILSSRGEEFRKGIEDQCTITILNTGHQLLNEKHANEIVKALAD